MAVAPITDHVDDHILLEPLTVFDGDPRAVDHGFYVVCVNMEDGRIHDLGYVRGIVGCARILRCRGEPNLVVDDDMDRAAGLVTKKVGEI